MLLHSVSVLIKGDNFTTSQCCRVSCYVTEYFFASQNSLKIPRLKEQKTYAEGQAHPQTSPRFYEPTGGVCVGLDRGAERLKRVSLCVEIRDARYECRDAR